MNEIKRMRLRRALYDLLDEATDGGVAMCDLEDAVNDLLTTPDVEAHDVHERLAGFGFSGVQHVLRTHCGVED